MGYTARINQGGNFCGHNPESPRLTLASPARRGKGGQPRVLTLLMERITAYYAAPRRVLPSLDLANGSQRQMRSERREACVCVIAAIIKNTDLASLRVGVPTPNGFLNFTFPWIARQCGLPLARVERAIRDLKRAGMLTVSQPRQLQADGSWRGLAAVKAVSRNLFTAFGLKSMLEIEMKKASKRLKKKAEDWQRRTGKKTTLTDMARFKLLMGGLGATPGKKRSQGAYRTLPPPAPPPDGIEAAISKQRMVLAGQMKINNPDWPIQKCQAEAERIIRARYSA